MGRKEKGFRVKPRDEELKEPREKRNWVKREESLWIRNLALNRKTDKNNTANLFHIVGREKEEMKTIIRISWVQPKQKKKKIVSENYKHSPCRTTWASGTNTHLCR